MRQQHWENVYATKDEQKVSWFEQNPALSLDLIKDAGYGSAAVVVDVGGGASHLVDALLSANQAGITVLDLSTNALDIARARLGKASEHVKWVVSDVTAWTPDRAYDVWHDRAAFHFLTEAADQTAYVAVLQAALKPGGVAIIGTFALDGPEKCSGYLSPDMTNTALVEFLVRILNSLRCGDTSTKRPGKACNAFSSALSGGWRAQFSSMRGSWWDKSVGPTSDSLIGRVRIAGRAH